MVGKRNSLKRDHFMTDSLFQPLALGDVTLNNRVVMAPMTRSRSQQPGNIPTPLMAEYYAQRSGCGLIVSEGTQVSPQGQGYAWTPGMHAPEQVEGWKAVTAAVHAAGGRIFAQLWHVGRISHPLVNGLQPVGPSAIQAEGAMVFVADEKGARMEPVPVPRALDTAEIAQTVADFAQAARNAVAAGFDGVEIHGANGYLIDQFLRSGSNSRTDAYGGSLANRTRFVGEVAQACVDAIGAGRVGVRLSPFLNVNGINDDTPHDTFLAAASVLSEVGVGYLHLNEESMGNIRGETPEEFRAALRAAYQGVIIVCGGYTGETARATLATGHVDMIGFGRPYISNPDLAERLRDGVAWSEASDRAAYFGGGAAGYTDYPRAVKAA